MPPALAPLLYPYSSIPGSITPTLQIYPQSGTCEKQQQQQFLDSTFNKPNCWTAPRRDGLPTPPSEMMNGVAYNAHLPSNPLTTTTTTTPGSYGSNGNGLSLHSCSKYPNHSRSSYGSSSLSSTSAAVTSKPQYQPTSSTKPVESVSQKKTTSSSLPSYLQIPSSISDTNGNLAEFAAQVYSYPLVTFWCQVTKTNYVDLFYR